MNASLPHDTAAQAEPEETGPQPGKPGHGKLYQWDGKKPRATASPNDGNSQRWVPLTEQAFQAALAVRAQVQKKTRMRPDLSIVIAAMLQHAAQSGGVAEAVAKYGLEQYSRAVAQDEPA